MTDSERIADVTSRRCGKSYLQRMNVDLAIKQGKTIGLLSMRDGEPHYCVVHPFKRKFLRQHGQT